MSDAPVEAARDDLCAMAVAEPIGVVQPAHREILTAADLAETTGQVT